MTIVKVKDSWNHIIFLLGNKVYYAMIAIFALILSLSIFDFVKLLMTNNNTASVSSITIDGQSEMNADEITQMNLFGAAPQVSVASESFMDELTKLELKGIFMSGDNVAGAIIAYRGGEEKIYKVGEILPNDTILAEVHTEMVVIKKGSESGKLILIENNS